MLCIESRKVGGEQLLLFALCASVVEVATGNRIMPRPEESFLTLSSAWPSAPDGRWAPARAPRRRLRSRLVPRISIGILPKRRDIVKLESLVCGEWPQRRRREFPKDPPARRAKAGAARPEKSLDNLIAE